MSTVTWVLDSGSYLVSSKEHLLMICQLGTFTGDDLITYSPGGSVPPSYITSNFRQTADIDLEADSNCFPIGRLTGTSFTGEYDGGSFSISNFTSPAASSAVHGLFGWIGGATLKDIKLAGNWNVTGSNENTDNSAALVARLNGSGNIIERIDINGVVNSTSNLTNSFGTLVGKIQGSVDITDILVRGNVNGTGHDFCGGVIGHIDSGTVTARNLRYAPTGDLNYNRPSGSGENGTNACAGIVGTIDAVAVVTIENAVNAMTGNITGLNAAGIIGMSLITNVSNAIFTNLVNAMTGDIITSGAGGGIFARTEIGTSSYLLNVMKGDITAGSRAGGISGLIFTGTAVNCIVAMNGDIVGDTLAISQVGAVELSTGTVTIEWATSDFGLTVFGSSIADVNTKPVAASPWAYHADFPEIPYLEMSAIDSELNTSYVGTPFPNISGNGTIYDLENDYYTVCFDSTFFPVETVLGVPISDYSLFKYDTTGLNVIESQGAGISFVAIPYSAIFIQVFTYIAIVTFYGGTASSFDVSSTQTGFSEIFQIEGSSSSTGLQITLDENTEYNVQVYGDGVVLGSKLFTTPVADNTSVTEMVTYLNNDLSSLQQSSLQATLGFIGGVLDTSDVLTAYVFDQNSVSERELTFVDDSETINISALSNLLTPFTVGGTSTNVVLEFSDNVTTETVTFNDATDNITVAGTTYNKGDVFIIDGKKCKVASLE